MSVDDVFMIVDEIEGKMCGSVGRLVDSVLDESDNFGREQQKEREDAFRFG